MNRDRVLVPMSRSEAEWYDALGERTGHGPTHRPIRAALDTDREALARRLAEALDPSGWRLLDASDRDMATAEVEAVLALLEGADDE